MFNLIVPSIIFLSNVAASVASNYVDTGLGKSLLVEQTEQFKFHEGRNFCHSTGGDLWLPDNDQELAWFQNNVQNEVFYWIGLVNGPPEATTLRKPRWIDGTLFAESKIFSNFALKNQREDKCVAYTLNGKFQATKVDFLAESCDLRQFFICEKKEVPKKVEYIEVSRFRKSFHFLRNYIPFDEASAYCGKNAGKLWLPSSEEEEASVTEMFIKSGFIWIASYKLDPFQYDFYSFDGRIVDRNEPEDKKLASQVNIRQNCSAQFLNLFAGQRLKNGVWCNVRLGVICERPLIKMDKEDKSSSGIINLIKKLSDRFDDVEQKLRRQKMDFDVQLTQNNGKMDMIRKRFETISKLPTNENRNQNFTCSPGGNCYFANNAKRTFNEARLYCLKSGGRLPTLKARDEQIWFAETFQERSDVWLDAKRDEGSANYRFLYGGELIDSNSNWKRGAKDGIANCCAVMSHYPYGAWLGEDCNNYVHVTICEKLN